MTARFLLLLSLLLIASPAAAQSDVVTLEFTMANYLPEAIGLDAFTVTTSQGDLIHGNFAFWNASGDSITIDGLEVTLTGADIEKLWTTQVRNKAGTNALFSLTFAGDVEDVTLYYSWVSNLEAISNFNIAPSYVTGNLVTQGAPISAVSGIQASDYNAGSITWANLDGGAIAAHHGSPILFATANYMSDAIALDAMTLHFAASADVTSDFGFWNASGDSTTINGVQVVLYGEDLEKHEGTRVRNVPWTNAVYILNVDGGASAITLHFSRVADFEAIAAFNPVPETIAGDLVASGTPVPTVRGASSGDYNAGSITWLLNSAPDCSAAAAAPDTLWPADHTMTDITISGVTDVDGDLPAITIDSIFQDEPVDGPGSSGRVPDGAGIGTTVAQVRAERDGGSNGRVYRIAFTARDGQGGSCNGLIYVGVPHDSGGSVTAVADAFLYDSTQP